jgi:hypothetical protein
MHCLMHIANAKVHTYDRLSDTDNVTYGMFDSGRS